MSVCRNAHQEELFNTYATLGRSVAKAATQNDADATLDHDSWQTISDEGIWRIAVPTELGGLGGSWKDVIAALEGLSTTAEDLGFLVTTLGHLGSIKVLLDEGTPRQKARWLPRLLEGVIGVTAMTEETGGSDLSRMQLAARQNGNGFIMSGKKVHITNAPVAQLGMIAGRIPALGKKKDITLFFVDLEGPSVRIGEIEDNLGIRTSPTASIEFDDVPLTLENIIGQPGDGLRVLYDIIAFERALYGAMAAGLIENHIMRTYTRVTERHAFGKPLSVNQYVQGRLTDMKMGAIVCRTLTYAAFEELDKGIPTASILCSATKYFAGENLLMSAENMVQLFGHVGYGNNEISRMLRDALGMRIAGGTSDIQRINIFNQMTRLQATMPVEYDDIPDPLVMQEDMKIPA
ncbi:acyl-CoA dehydrogenase [Tateyamaria omphalii]|uniref:acyl-CoA dehydrogenase family protein n=1 Tax=Tateyamaria omphalii TaxID=299262 RepID=UPI0016757233|nr:acyl-CoA dehydrogenase family protein [Tateyamaria omphalii]GGX65267.1 acyl-CoA dehydrogenase [Tateyamaria omphalii]